jgi:hypothetical protein
MDRLIGSRKALLAKESRMTQALEFSSFENRPKKIKALEKLREKLSALDSRIKKLNHEL